MAAVANIELLVRGSQFAPDSWIKGEKERVHMVNYTLLCFHEQTWELGQSLSMDTHNP